MDDFNSQLETVEKALLVTTDDGERASLQSLRADLLELLELTSQTSNLDSANIRTDETKKDPLDDEITKFMNEVGQLNKNKDEVKLQSTVREEADVESELLELKKKMESMIGQKCSAPHEHTWGAVAYHNAIICGIGNSADLEDDGSMSLYLRVLFTNPTHREMLPCLYYLDGECKFDSTNCHYSHGELVLYSDLQEYTEPDFEKLIRNCIVLAKMHDRLWHKGRVLCSNFVEKICRVRLDDNLCKEKELDFPFENLFPIYQDDDPSCESSSDTETHTDSEDIENQGTIIKSNFCDTNLFAYTSSQELGEWEKHTRGIGSKLMAKMGYIQGSGLGVRGNGLITPISTQVLPQGCSLDHCMNLREAANGSKDFFSVELKIKRDKKKQDALNAKAYEREVQRVDVFSFLNTNILNSNSSRTQVFDGAAKHSLQNQSTKSLNVESVRIADDIRKKAREIAKVEESMRRHSTGTDVHKRLQTQLNNKQHELNTLKQAEQSLSKEQATRKTRDKLCVF